MRFSAETEFDVVTQDGDNLRRLLFTEEPESKRDGLPTAVRHELTEPGLQVCFHKPTLSWKACSNKT